MKIHKHGTVYMFICDACKFEFVAPVSETYGSRNDNTAKAHCPDCGCEVEGSKVPWASKTGYIAGEDYEP